jgi:hypothetical protein
MIMTIRHKCQGKIVSNKATRETTQHQSYSEHAAMHYGGDGWSHWTTTVYLVEKCKKCGKSHEIKEADLL